MPREEQLQVMAVGCWQALSSQPCHHLVFGLVPASPVTTQQNEGLNLMILKFLPALSFLDSLHHSQVTPAYRAHGMSVEACGRGLIMAVEY